MKVILLQDVAKLGQRHNVVDVPHGRALNMLIPKGLAEAATPENLKCNKARSAKIETDRAANDASFEEATELLKEKKIKLSVEANDKGHLFEALKAEKIVEALSSQGVTIDISAVIIDAPIKEIGDHTLSLVSGDIRSTFTITIEAA